MKRTNKKEQRERDASGLRAYHRALSVQLFASALGCAAKGDSDSAGAIGNSAAWHARRGLRARARVLPPVDPSPIYRLVIGHLEGCRWGQAEGCARLLLSADLETVRGVGADLIALMQRGGYGAALQRVQIALEARRALSRGAGVQYA